MNDGNVNAGMQNNEYGKGRRTSFADDTVADGDNDATAKVPRNASEKDGGTGVVGEERAPDRRDVVDAADPAVDGKMKMERPNDDSARPENGAAFDDAVAAIPVADAVAATSDGDDDVDYAAVEDLEEEVILHETTIESLAARLSALDDEIEAEEAGALSLRADIELSKRRKSIFRKRTDNNLRLVGELEASLERCLERLRRALDAGAGTMASPASGAHMEEGDDLEESDLIGHGGGEAIEPAGNDDASFQAPGEGWARSGTYDSLAYDSIADSNEGGPGENDGDAAFGGTIDSSAANDDDEGTPGAIATQMTTSGDEAPNDEYNYVDIPLNTISNTRWSRGPLPSSCKGSTANPRRSRAPYPRGGIIPTRPRACWEESTQRASLQTP